MNNQSPTAQSGPSDRAIAQAFREATAGMVGSFAQLVLDRAAQIDRLSPPAGARDAVTDALEALAVRVDKRDQWMRTKTAPNLGLADAFKDAAADIRALTGKADGGDSTDYDCPDCGKRNYKPYRCLNCGYDPLAHKSTQPAATGAGEVSAETALTMMCDELYATINKPEWIERQRARILARLETNTAATGMGDSAVTEALKAAELWAISPSMDAYSDGNLLTIATDNTRRLIALAAAYNDLAAQPAPVDVRDYAMEHAEYMAVDAWRLIESINEADRLRDECDQSVESIDEVEAAYATRGECMTGLQSAIYEFRKRRDRQTAQPAPVVGGDAAPSAREWAESNGVAVTGEWMAGWDACRVEYPRRDGFKPWRREWQGSGPQRGFHIREDVRLHNDEVVAYLGDKVSGEEVDKLIAAHNALLAARPGGDAFAELREDAPRAAELAERLVAAGPKASHVSCSETHEISEFVLATVAALAHPAQAGGGRE